MPRCPALAGLAAAQGIQLYRRADERAERIGRQRVALVDINGTACIAHHAGIEQARRVGQGGAFQKGELYRCLLEPVDGLAGVAQRSLRDGVQGAVRSQ